MRVKLNHGPEGQVLLPNREAELLGRKPGDEVELIALKNACALVMNPGRGGELAFVSGSLFTVSIAEVVQLIFASLKTGVLSLQFAADRRQTIFFQQGSIVFASSTDPSFRLGNVLFRYGKVKPADLVRCGGMVKGGKPLGQVLVDEKVLTAAELYAGVATQVREIFLGAFMETGGHFVFIEGEFEERNAVKLTERTRELLLEGVRRIDEIERIGYDAIPDREAIPSLAAKGVKSADPREARLLELVDGKRSYATIVQESTLGTYEGFAALGRLLKQKVLSHPQSKPKPKPAPPADEEVFSISTSGQEESPAPAPKVSGPFDTYRRIIKHVFGALSAARPDARERLNTYFDRLPDKQRAIFENVRIEPEGEIDVAQVHLNVTASGAYKGGAARARALEALESFVAFSVFEAKNALGKDAAEKLLRDVGKIGVGKL